MKTYRYLRELLLSPIRYTGLDPVSRKINDLWIPAYAGMTFLRDSLCDLMMYPMNYLVTQAHLMPSARLVRWLKRARVLTNYCWGYLIIR